MMKLVLFLHLIGASIWVGGHLYLLLRLMPSFVRHNDVAGFLAFEKSYEPLGVLALVVQVVTGLYMAQRLVAVELWQVGNYATYLIWAKLGLLLMTVITALHARFFVVARLQKGNYTDHTLTVMAIHVALICLYAVVFVLVGVLFRG